MNDTIKRGQAILNQRGKYHMLADRTRHGHNVSGKRSATYQSWADMKKRCLNLKCKAYPLYGGRGVKICERWRFFPNFLDDMGVDPDGLTLDRINTDGDYTPENCRWISIQDQQNNRRNNVNLTFRGETLNVKQWSRRIGICHQTIQCRLNRGWTIDRVLSTPPLFVPYNKK